jgi:hypothetical protein
MCVGVMCVGVMCVGVIPEVVGSIPTVVRQTFQLARCGCTLRVTSQILFPFVKPINE